MPVSKSAKKALRRDAHRAEFNQKLRSQFRSAIAKAKAQPTPENLKLAYSLIDRSAKKGLIHDNKAARLKSQLAKTPMVAPKTVKPKTSKPKTKRRPRTKAKA